MKANKCIKRTRKFLGMGGRRWGVRPGPSWVKMANRWLAAYISVSYLKLNWIEASFFKLFYFPTFF